MTESIVATRVAVEEYELTILMPCLNEAETLEKCIDKASRAFNGHSGMARWLCDHGR